jgi:hypothetical protein
LRNDLETNINEQGYNQKLSNFNGLTSFLTTPKILGTSPTYVNLPATWSWDATNGYTIGFTHSHPDGTGPSPDDIFDVITLLNKYVVPTNNPVAVNFYEQNVSLTVVTVTQTYVVTVNDWSALLGCYNSYNKDPATFVAGMASNVNNVSGYEAALLKTFGSSINVFSNAGETNDHTFHPLSYNPTTNTSNKVNCP